MEDLKAIQLASDKLKFVLSASVANGESVAAFIGSSLRDSYVRTYKSDYYKNEKIFIMEKICVSPYCSPGCH